ncbi:hypothetical protein GWK47_046229 [Chionoecetes opilio]|uniref:Uncharacterized protein n=1 Tax=Chionoecetes opilio TaxID=41210 RepID=A0A8J5CWG7_CHIOP|nr:hypothetical protein GWK47_046229 [Chionoecetes opilio]
MRGLCFSSSRFLAWQRFLHLQSMSGERRSTWFDPAGRPCWGDDFLLWPRGGGFARFAGAAPPTAPYFSSEQQLKVFWKLDERGGLELATDRGRRLFLGFRGEKAAAFFPGEEIGPFS